MYIYIYINIYIHIHRIFNNRLRNQNRKIVACVCTCIHILSIPLIHTITPPYRPTCPPTKIQTYLIESNGSLDNHIEIEILHHQPLVCKQRFLQANHTKSNIISCNTIHNVSADHSASR